MDRYFEYTVKTDKGIIKKDLAGVQFTLERIYTRIGDRMFTSEDVAKVLNLNREEWENKSVQVRLMRMRKRKWLDIAKESKKGRTGKNKFIVYRLSEKSLKYRKNWGTFTNEEGPFMGLFNYQKSRLNIK